MASPISLIPKTPKSPTGWWYTYPYEKYESQLGSLFPIYGKIKNVPNHQPANSVFEQQKIHLRVARSVSVASAWIRNAKAPTCRRQRHQRCEGSDGITTRRHAAELTLEPANGAFSCSERAFFECRLALVFYIYIYRIIGYVYMIIIHHYIPRTCITEKTLSPTQVRVPHQAVHSSPFDLWRPKSTLRKLQLGFCSVFRLKYSRAGIEPNFG